MGLEQKNYNLAIVVYILNEAQFLFKTDSQSQDSDKYCTS